MPLRGPPTGDGNRGGYHPRTAGHLSRRLPGNSAGGRQHGWSAPHRSEKGQASGEPPSRSRTFRRPDRDRRPTGRASRPSLAPLRGWSPVAPGSSELPHLAPIGFSRLQSHRRLRKAIPSDLLLPSLESRLGQVRRRDGGGPSGSLARFRQPFRLNLFHFGSSSADAVRSTSTSPKRVPFGGPLRLDRRGIGSRLHGLAARRRAVGCVPGAARAGLRWTTAELAQRSGVGVSTIKRAEASDGASGLTGAIGRLSSVLLKMAGPISRSTRVWLATPSVFEVERTSSSWWGFRRPPGLGLPVLHLGRRGREVLAE